MLDPVARPEQALRVANRMRQLLMDTAKNSGTACGASIGLAISRPDDTVSSLLNRADSAMYRAKSRRDSSIEMAPATDDTMHEASSPDDSAEAPIP